MDSNSQLESFNSEKSFQNVGDIKPDELFIKHSFWALYWVP